MERTAIYIDIEGFSPIYHENEVEGLRLLGKLMEGIYRIGSRAIPETSARLLVHQTGDGFLILCEIADCNPSLPIAIGIILMRYVLDAGGVAKCGISRGRFADVKGCYPEMIQEHIETGGVVRMGEGFMRILPVMGTALVNAYGLTRKAKGALFLLDSKLAAALPLGVTAYRVNQECFAIDWIHTHIATVDELCARGEIYLPPAGQLDQLLNNYLSKYGPESPAPLPPEWRSNTLSFNHVAQPA